MLKLIPFNSAWVTHDKIDIHAIYRRPRFVSDAYGELHRDVDKHGMPTWDLTPGLPVRSHNRWLAKGFEYVTLADRAALRTAAMHGTITGNWREYDQHQTGGPWNFKKYNEGQEATTTLEAEELVADVHQFGSVAVEAIRRRSNSDFALPAHLRNIPIGGPREYEPAPEPAVQATEVKVEDAKPPRFAKRTEAAV